MKGSSPALRYLRPKNDVLTRLSLILGSSTLIIILSLFTVGGTKVEKPASRAETADLVALQTSTPSIGLQRRSNPTAAPNIREIECQRQHDQWDKNLPSRSLATGAVFYFILLSVFTILGFSTPFVRGFGAFLVAAILSPTVVGLQKREAFRVCPEPANIYGILTADLFVWTLIGILLTTILLLIIRQFSAVRKLNPQQPT